MTTLSTSVSTTVIVGSPEYLSPLTIEKAGDVAPTESGATGAEIISASTYPNASSYALTNLGTITGGTGAAGLSGGVGVDLGAGTLNNSGTITGGVGGAGGGAGGTGIVWSAGAVLNDQVGSVNTGYVLGTITGGVGGASSAATAAGTGGTGIAIGPVAAGTAQLKLDVLSYGEGFGESFVGGAGGAATGSGAGGIGGIGISLGANVSLDANGSLVGGNGGTSVAGPGGVGGAGTVLASGAYLRAGDGVVGGNGAGDAGGGDGAIINGGTLVAGEAIGGAGDNQGGTTGAGVVLNGGYVLILGEALGGVGSGTGIDLNAGSAVNRRTIEGGAGTTASGGAGAVVGSGATLSNQYYSLIRGGYSNLGGAGGTGVIVDAGGTLSNSSSNIYGGTGNQVGQEFTNNGAAAGSGGVGVNLLGGASFDNQGNIAGGAAGTIDAQGTLGLSYTLGVAGRGVVIDSGATLTNSAGAKITGGAGGSNQLSGSGGNGGTGVYLDGGTFTNAGAVSGGAGGIGTGTGSTNGAVGDAVQFGPSASTLVVDAGASFTGAIGGFAVGDTIDITNLDPTTVGKDFAHLTLTTGTDGTLQFVGDFSKGQFQFNPDGGTGTDITLTTLSSSQDYINGTVAYTVNLGSSLYPSPLTVTSTGEVLAPTSGNGIQSVISDTSLTNEGTVTAGAGAYDVQNGGTGGIGVTLADAATVIDSGTITGGAGGGSSATGNGGQGGLGVALYSPGAVLTNQSAGSITGGAGGYGGATGGDGGYGVQFGGATLTNDGAITGGSGGTASFGAGSTGVGGPGAIGVDLTAGSITTSGSITGGAGGYAATGGNGGVGLLVNTGSSGGTNSGTITGGAGGNSAVYRNGGLGGDGIVLNAGTFTNSGHIVGGAGGNGQLSGANAGYGARIFGGTLINTGSIATGVDGSGPTGSYTGEPGVQIDGGTLITSGTITGSFDGDFNSVAFGGAAGSTLVVQSGAVFNGPISGFGGAPGATIDITNLTPTQVSYDFGESGALQFAGSDSGNTLTTPNDGMLAFSNSYSGLDFLLSSDGTGGTDITIQAAACYCRGTRILAERGEVPVEALKIGDSIRTLSGDVRPVRWIGRRRYSGSFASRNPDILPVLIQAGAIAEGVPRRDLWVSPGHAMYIDDMLISARDLVNGHTIEQVDSIPEVTYFHLEFDAHEVIIAEGAPSESFVDEVSRETFDNAAEFHRLFPEAVRKPARYCAPRVEEGWKLEAVRRRLAERASSIMSTPLASYSHSPRRLSPEKLRIDETVTGDWQVGAWKTSSVRQFPV